MVGVVDSSNSSVVKRSRRDDFPTPLSPTSSTCSILEVFKALKLLGSSEEGNQAVVDNSSPVDVTIASLRYLYTSGTHAIA